MLQLEDQTNDGCFFHMWSDRRPWWAEGEGGSSGYLPKRLDGVVWCTAVAHPAHFAVTPLPQLQLRSRQSQVNCISADSIELELVITSTHFLILFLSLMQSASWEHWRKCAQVGCVPEGSTGCKLFEYSWTCVRYRSFNEHQHMEMSTLHTPRSLEVTKLWKLIYSILYFLCLMAKQVSTRSNTKLTKLVCYLTLAIFANTKESPFGDAQWRWFSLE